MKQWHRARELDLGRGPFLGGVVFFPYRLSLGVSVAFWPCIKAPVIVLYLGPVKLWLSWIIKKGDVL